jgi:hypothetical protein
MPRTDLVDIPAGTALLGTDRPHLPIDGEGPLRKKKMTAFRIAATCVTNAEFTAFGLRCEIILSCTQFLAAVSGRSINSNECRQIRDV